MKQLALIPLVAAFWLSAGCAEDEDYGEPIEPIGESIEDTTQQTGEALEEAGDRITE